MGSSSLNQVQSIPCDAYRHVADEEDRYYFAIQSTKISFSLQAGPVLHHGPVLSVRIGYELCTWSLQVNSNECMRELLF